MQSPGQIDASGSPYASMDDMLDSADEHHPLPVVSPEPLWQLEFGSCWQQMQDSPITENPNDLILDIGEWDKATGSQREEDIVRVIKTFY